MNTNRTQPEIAAEAISKMTYGELMIASDDIFNIISDRDGVSSAAELADVLASWAGAVQDARTEEAN